MAISTINQNGLNAPLTLTSPVLTTPNLGTPSAINLTNATSLPWAALPSASVLQIASGKGPATDTYGITSPTNILSVTITPKFSTSKILVIGMVSIDGTANSNCYTWMKVLNNATAVTVGSPAVTVTGAPNAVSLSGGGVYIGLDSPASTSLLTYNLQVGKGSGGTTSLGVAANYATLILMEIAG